MPSADDTADSSRRGLLTVSVVLAVVALLAIGIALSVRDDRGAGTAAAPIGADRGEASVSLAAGGPMLLFRNTNIGDAFGRLAFVPADDPEAERTMTGLDCERVDFRSDVGVCLQADRGADTTYRAIGFDDRFRHRWSVELAGPPSRVRISPGGSVAGITVFLTDHSYVDSGFSTQTTIVDLADGRSVGDLEDDYEVIRDGESWREVDFNFWGVTFTDETSFYATLGTEGETFLVRGDTTTQTMTVDTPDGECPSVSPDGTRLAYKLRTTVDGRVHFRLAVMDLTSGRVVTLAESRSVDDQVAWLDADTLMYGVADVDSPAEQDTWIVAADGTGTPELLLPGSWSTRVVAAPSA